MNDLMLKLTTSIPAGCQAVCVCVGGGRLLIINSTDVNFLYIFAQTNSELSGRRSILTYWTVRDNMINNVSTPRAVIKAPQSVHVDVPL